MANRLRRSSMRTRLRVEDVSTWISYNQPVYSATTADEPHVHFAPPLEIPDDESDAGSTESSLVEEPRYLNGGYGWFIVVCSFILHAVIDGTSFGFGVIFPKIQQHFDSNRTGASVVAALFLAFPLLLAPIAGIVTDVLECKKTIIIGGVICLVCTTLSLLCETVESFAIVFGAGNGLGMSFIYNAAIVMITYYFNDHRGIATAIAVTGTGFGTVFFPSYQSLVVHFYGDSMRATLFSIIALMAIIVLVGFVVRDVQWVSDTKEYKEKLFNRRVREMNEDVDSPSNGAFHDIVERVPRRASSMPSISTMLYMCRKDFNSSVQSVNDATNALIDQPARSRSVGTFMARRTQAPLVPEYTMINTTDLVHLEHLDLQMTNSPSTTIHSKSNRRRMLSKTSMSVDRIDEMGSQDKLNLNIGLESTSESLVEEESSASDSEMSNDGDSSSSELSDRIVQAREPNGTAKDLKKTEKELVPEEKKDGPTSARVIRSSLAPGISGMSAGRVMASNVVQPRLRMQTNLIGLQGRIKSEPSLVLRKKRKNMFSRLGLGTVFSVLSNAAEEVTVYRSLLKNTSFVMFLVSVMSLYAALDVPYVFFIDHATENLNIPKEHAQYLTSTIGIVNVLSTFACGFFVDIKRVKNYVFVFYGLAMFGIAASLLMAAYMMTFTGMMIVSGTYGALVSANYVMQSILLTHIFDDMSVFQSAYSLTSFCEGLATIFGPLIIGMIRDYYGTYTPVFFIAGGLCLLSSIISFCIHRMEHMRNEDDDSVVLNGNHNVIDSVLERDVESGLLLPHALNGSPK